MKKAYVLKGTGFTVSPSDEKNLWEAPWNIVSADKEPMGHASFEGPKANGTIPFSIELEKKYRNQGFGRQAIRLMCDFAFLHPDIYEVTAVSDAENDAYITALEKAGFVLRGKEGKSEIYSVEKPKSTWMGLYLLLGFIVGLALGIVIDLPWVGLVLGLFLGFVFGAYMDNNENKRRKKITGEK